MAEAAIITMICAHNGSMKFDDIRSILGLNNEDMDSVLGRSESFVVAGMDGQKTVIARTEARLCRAQNCPGCANLHLCKWHLFGSCRFAKGRRGCRFSHDLMSDQNEPVLTAHGLNTLDIKHLCILLLQSDTSLLPAVCHSYNNGAGQYGRCQDAENCKRLHICEKYLRGSCDCTRAHDFYEPHPLQTLQDRGVPGELMPIMKDLYSNIEALRTRFRNNPSAQNPRRGPNGQNPRGGPNGQNPRGGPNGQNPRGGPNGQNPRRGPNTQNPRGRPNTQNPRGLNGQNRRASSAFRGQEGQRPPQSPIEKTEICMYFIKGFCKHGDSCYKEHSSVSYKWEVKEGSEWKALPDNEVIEKDYCDPERIYSSGINQIYFDVMTQGPHSVRRLSTVSSVLQPTFILTTEWLWYWEDENGIWIPYASAEGGHSVSSISSAELEQQYQADSSAVVEFTAGSQTYTLSFQDMIQENKRYSTKKVVRRRPKFVSAADVQTIKTTKRTFNTLKALPEHWDKALTPETGFKRVSLQSTASEYIKISDLFNRTMRGFSILKIDRIQNRALWEVFQWQKDCMSKSRRGRDVCEKQLFHGTDRRHVDAISLNNFDWRICGTHGTAYGKGSYFARDAKYSHSYTTDAGPRSMFVCRVLAGDYTRGDAAFLRPPSKDGGDTVFYDSCVNDPCDPSIFVVFEKHQIYPEYLIEYRDSSVCEDVIMRPAPAVRTHTPAYGSARLTASSSVTSSSSHAYPSSSSRVPPYSSARLTPSHAASSPITSSSSRASSSSSSSFVFVSSSSSNTSASASAPPKSSKSDCILC